MADQIPAVKRCPRRDSAVSGVVKEMKTCITKYVILSRPNLRGGLLFVRVFHVTIRVDATLFQKVPVISTSKKGNTILALARMRLSRNY